VAETLTAPDELETIAPPASASRPTERILPGARMGRAGFLASVSASLDDRRLFVLMPFAMIAGVVIAASQPVERFPLVLAGGAVVLAVALVLSRGNVVAFRALALLSAAWVGTSLLPIHGALFGTPMLGSATYGSYLARVDEILEATASEQKLVISHIEAVGNDGAVDVRRAHVVIDDAAPVSPGDVISGSLRLSPVPGPVFPGQYDTQFESYFEGIGAYGSATRATGVVPSEEIGPARLIDDIRRGISARIDAVLLQPSAGVARAIINGDESEVTDTARTTMATAGIAHVLSVSGLHLSIVAGGTFWILRLLLAGFGPIASRVPVKRIAALGGMGAALFYFAISGGNVAAFRSTLMILLVFGAVLFGRRALTMRNVAIAGLIVVASDPSSVFRPSFQLSFAAVVALVGAYETIRSNRTRDAGLLAHAWGYFKGIVITSLVAGTATVLFSIYHFQQTSPLGVVGNLGTLPLVGFIMMPSAALALLAMPFDLERPFLLAMGWSVDRMLDLAAIVAGWSQHLRAAPLLTPAALLIGLGALCWFAFFKDRWRLLGPVAAVPLVVAFAVDHPPDVLVADTTQAVVVRGATGLELAAGKPQSFALNIWRETLSDPIANPADETCSSGVCSGESTAGFSYVITKSAAAFADACTTANLVIIRAAAPSACATATVIDATALAAHGVHWLRWNDQAKAFEVRTAIPDTERPWRPRP